MRKILQTFFGNIPCDVCGVVLKEKKYLVGRKLVCDNCRVKE